MTIEELAALLRKEQERRQRILRWIVVAICAAIAIDVALLLWSLAVR